MESKLRSSRSRQVVVLLLLAAATLAAYWGVWNHEFILWDDDLYVTANPNVQSGLSGESLAWAFNIGYAANWHPLTWVSHTLDWHLFGAEPAGHHATNLILHIANALLLFVALNRMTGAIRKSAFVAAVFALHPLHVESVAWVSERKDLLSTFFGILAILAYTRFAEKPRLPQYLLTIAAFALSLMSKPMLVTLPLLLLLLDYWPLRRFGRSGVRPLLEKAPMLAMSVASAVLTIAAQSKGGAIASVQDCPFAVRLANAAVSYVSYVLKMLWPTNLLIDYPYIQDISAWSVAGSLGFVAAVTVVTIRMREKSRYLLVGWLWYVVMLLPVIGVLQVGDQSMADRYTYMPLIGLLIAVAWGVSALADRMGVRQTRPRGTRMALLVLAVAALVLLGVTTHIQKGYWRDSVTLFEHTLAVAPNSPILHNNLGAAYAARDEINKAVFHCEQALSLNPNYAEAHYNLGNYLRRKGDISGAAQAYSRAIDIKPDYAKAHNDLAYVYISLRRYDEAIEHGEAALRVRPDYAQAHGNLAVAYYYKADYARAWKEVQLCERYGCSLPSGLIQDIATKLRQSPSP